jgi:hypothetical protein
VMLSVAILNEVLEIRARRRWSVLAQYVMFELIRDARMVWTALMDLAGLMPEAETQSAAIESAATIVGDTPRLTAALRDVLADPRRRTALREAVVRLVVHNDEVLGRWAAVMLNADLYAEVVDRHVELAGSLAWLGSLLEQAEPSEDALRRHRARSNPVVGIGGELDDEGLAARLVGVAQLAEELDRGTLELAARIVPVEWWRERLEPRAADPVPREAEPAGAGAGASLSEP